jgi:hypothetical protein
MGGGIGRILVSLPMTIVGDIAIRCFDEAALRDALECSS